MCSRGKEARNSLQRRAMQDTKVDLTALIRALLSGLSQCETIRRRIQLRLSSDTDQHEYYALP